MEPCIVPFVRFIFRLLSTSQTLPIGVLVLIRVAAIAGDYEVSLPADSEGFPETHARDSLGVGTALVIMPIIAISVGTVHIKFLFV